METKEYRFLTEIINDQDSSYISDVAFNPDGSIFAVTYRDNDEVRIYDSTSLALLRTYSNPESLLCFPHGIACTEKYIIVSNKIISSYVEPGIFTVYKFDDPSSKPVTVFRTPLENLGEAHSFDIHDGKLVVTYCYGGSCSAAIVTYQFDHETGSITGPTGILDGFEKYGEPKGICFYEDGKKIIISITNDSPDNQHHFSRLAIFDIDSKGILSKEPVQIIKKQGTRIENINITDGLCVITDPMNDTVSIHNLNDENCFDSQIQIIQDNLAFPHSACISPDQKLLVVTNYGVKVSAGNIEWRNFLTPRSDKIVIFGITK